MQESIQGAPRPAMSPAARMRTIGALALSIAEALDDLAMHGIELAKGHEQANRTDFGAPVESHLG